ncbi:lipoprotein insertase outer membrane protein LolB [Paraburkholderia bonniea]|uniref:lipoprotein insertase outer membrane protein LolB n=1 Tax=Paraburkholderia bonniea TaxID=2152891 RepID=UPI001290FB25|nr:lipoprotein insertase outer membrane protein LolB [Paraburkholderia bonniea]WJF89955.1 lipoprotein insertase outer membrane protein LolB [Paraburkholderia bonniea]WJF93269.1 lipoprotein insertase outer membrane protein LolB [Paraburkholderia bonniea]
MRLSRCAGALRRVRAFRLTRAGITATAVIALAGCTSFRSQEPTAADAASTIATQTNNARHGRFAVQYVDQNGQQRNAYGNFDWQETDATVTLQLRSPLGQTLAIVTSSPASATLELPNRQPLTASNVAELMENALGFALPVEGLRYWLQPAPAPTSRARTEMDPHQQGHIRQISQDGWTIDYLAYADAPTTRVKRINLSRQDPPLAIKLVLDQ